jgi:hypothetical protein
MFFSNEFINGLLAKGQASAGVFNLMSGLAVLKVPDGKAAIIIGYKFHAFADLPEGLDFANAIDVRQYSWHQMRFIGSKGINTMHFRSDVIELNTNSGTRYYAPTGITQSECFFTSDTDIIIEISGNGRRVNNWVITPNQLPNEVPPLYREPPFGYGKKGPASIDQIEYLRELGPSPWDYRPFNSYTPPGAVAQSFTSFQWPLNSNYALNPPQFNLPFGSLSCPLVEINFVVVNKDVTNKFTGNITG